MAQPAFVDNAKVMAKGQVTIPKDIRPILGVDCGDRISFVVENGSVRIVNSAVFAMQMFQAQMQGVTNTPSEEEVAKMITVMRRGENDEGTD